MRKNKEDRKEQKIRALYRELKDIGICGFSTDRDEPEIRREPKIVRAETTEHVSEEDLRLNFQYAKALWDLFGCEGPYKHIYPRRRTYKPSREPSAPFLTISGETYEALPASLNHLYKRSWSTMQWDQTMEVSDAVFNLMAEKHYFGLDDGPDHREAYGVEVVDAETNRVHVEAGVLIPTDEFGLKHKYREGWKVQRGIKVYPKPNPGEDEARRQEIKQRLEKIGGDNYQNVLRKYIYGPSHWTNDRWGKDEQKLREECLEKDMEQEIIEACEGVGGLREVRHTENGTHSYLEIGPDCYDDYAFYQRGEWPEEYRNNLSHEEEMKLLEEQTQLINEHRPGRAHVDLHEKLNGSAEKLHDLKNKLS